VQTTQPTVVPHGQRLERASVMSDHVNGDDYNLRLLIERMQRMHRSEREIEVAVREASGCLSHPAGSRWTAQRRLPFRGRLWKREEGQR
jgi:hypothetical protein